MSGYEGQPSAAKVADQAGHCGSPAVAPALAAVSSLAGVAFNGRRSRRLYSMPVQYAWLGGDDLVLYPGRPSQKVCWCNFEELDDVTIRLAGHEERRKAQVMRPGDLKYDAARQVYASCFKSITNPAENPLVLLTW